MTEWDVERLLARSQLGLSILIFAGYFSVMGLAAFNKIDGSYVKELTPIVSLVAFYWFQRQRPQSATDQNGHERAPANPTVISPETPKP